MKSLEEQHGSTTHSRALCVVVSAVEAHSFGAHSEGKACAPGPQAVLRGSSVYREVFQDFSGIGGFRVL